MNKGNCFRNIFYLGVVMVVGLIIYSLISPIGEKSPEVSISEIAQAVQDGEVVSISVDQNQITAKLKDGQEQVSYKESSATLKDYGITPEKVQIEVKNPDKGSFWPTFLSIVLPFLLIGGF